jgi:hypothetical protein
VYRRGHKGYGDAIRIPWRVGQGECVISADLLAAERGHEPAFDLVHTEKSGTPWCDDCPASDAI